MPEIHILTVLGYFGAILVGLFLGLIGGGGSILTVPILVYLFGISPLLATSYSLFIVALSSIIGSVNNFKNGLIHPKTSVFFLLSSVSAIFFTRKFVLPSIPEILFQTTIFTLTKDVFILIMFAILMISSAYSMIKKPEFSEVHDKLFALKIPELLLVGASVGLVTGFVGAGGGFVIVPALYFIARLEIKQAIATSLFIIAVNSTIGFLSDLHHQEMDWNFLLTYSAFAVAGIFIGTFAAKKISSDALKPIFGWMVLLMGIFILTKELVFK